MKRAAHMIKTAAVSVCAVSDGRAGPSGRYIRDACRGVSASAPAGAVSMSAQTGSKEVTLITSNDQTRSCALAVVGQLHALASALALAQVPQALPRLGGKQFLASARALTGARGCQDHAQASV
jgi:hypothetical protein